MATAVKLVNHPRKIPPIDRCDHAKKIWQAAIGEDVPNVLGGPQKKSCWTAANEESVKLKLLFGRTLSLSSKGSLIRLNGSKSMFGGVARGWQVEWGSVWGCI